MSFKFKTKGDLKGLKKLQRRLKKLAKTEVEWGWINGKAYPRNDINGRGGIPYAIVAIHNEYGAYVKNAKANGKYIYIPPRPYFQQSTQSSASYLLTEAHDIASNVLLDGDYQLKLKEVGEANVGILKASIARQNMTPLHPKTIGFKGDDTQWRDTGKMIENISSKVVYKRSDYKG
ncbi:hypothetical protein [Acinetobacter baumannii]|uniref:hypothetical protein n=1 Tax=Acinetobacter baumannii TaxID=470 RepID=UPI00366B2BF9